jgi:hypothetical protein
MCRNKEKDVPFHIFEKPIQKYKPTNKTILFTKRRQQDLVHVPLYIKCNENKNEKIMIFNYVIGMSLGCFSNKFRNMIFICCFFGTQ